MPKPLPAFILRQTARPVFRTSLRRPITTVRPSQQSRSWRSSAVRWGLAIGGLYYYNTSELFADAPSISPSYQISAPAPEAPAPTLESIAASRQQRHRPPPPTPSSSSSSSESSQKSIDPSSKEASRIASGDPGTLEETEEGAGQQAAYNEETGEINWDCPCLGGMAHGPCGEQFKEAFSCFVYSKEDPKGMDCIDNFKKMQDCFRAHPDHYGDELSGDDDMGEMDEESESNMGQAGTQIEEPAAGALPSPTISALSHAPVQSHKSDELPEAKQAKAASEQVMAKHWEPEPETNELVPKAWHDTTERNIPS